MIWGLVEQSLAQQAAAAMAAKQTARSRPAPPTPFGIGGLGLSRATQKFRQHTLALIAKNRMKLQKVHEEEPAAEEGNVVARVSSVVAAAVTPCPVEKQVVKHRIRAVVAGASLLYTAMNLAGSAEAVMHVDFSHDFVTSAKTVLDFVMNAPSVHNMVGDIVQIGVAVGLGMAKGSSS